MRKQGKSLEEYTFCFLCSGEVAPCINASKRTWIGHDFKKRSSLRGPLIHTIELFPCPRKQLRSKNRGCPRPDRWKADETNVWRGDGVEVHGRNGVEHLALVHDAVTRD